MAVNWCERVDAEISISSVKIEKALNVGCSSAGIKLCIREGLKKVAAEVYRKVNRWKGKKTRCKIVMRE